MTQFFNGLSELVSAVRASTKYRAVCEPFVASIGAREMHRHRTFKDAIKATRNKLHQVAGAYQDGAPPYSRWLAELQSAAGLGDPDTLRAACVRMMAAHASSRERLPILDRFYTQTLAGLPPIRSVLDVACGLNPLALPWMGLPPGLTYRAYDIYMDMTAFLNAFFGLLPGVVDGLAEARDVLSAPPEGHYDLALVLKTLPCLEQIDRQAGERLLDQIDADSILVTFPARSLGGRNKGMTETYSHRFLDVAQRRHWTIRRWSFESELAFMVNK